MKDSKAYLAYCGLNCRMCSIIATVPVQANTLYDTMKDDGWEYWGAEVYPKFDTFWKVLKDLCTKHESCPACIGGCGDPDCKIRACAQAKGLEVCAFCDEFPCRLLRDFSAHYPFILKNNERIKEIGIEAWLIEQDELVAKGITNRSLAKG